MNDTLQYNTVTLENVKYWHSACKVEEFPEDGGLCIHYKGLQIAVFNFTQRNEWYATQNLCPHKHQMILSRGMLGSEDKTPKVACPFHKFTFSLIDGSNLNGNECALATYPVKVDNGMVLIGFAEK